MKILHIIPTYLPAPLASGPIEAVHTLNIELVKLGVDVTVYTTNFDGKEKMDVPLSSVVLIDGVKVFYFPLSISSWQYSPGMRKALKQSIKNFDVVHVSSIFLSFLALGAYYAKKFKVPYVVSPHGMLMKEPLKSKSLKKRIYLKLIEKGNLEKAAAIHFTTELEKEESLLAGVLFKKTVVVPHGVALTTSAVPSSTSLFRTTFKIPESKKVVLFLGRLNWIKGLDTLLLAFKQVLMEKSNTVLVLAGPDGGYKDAILEDIKRLDLHRDVILTGETEGKLKEAIFLESDVFVLTSYSENFSIAVCEAMAQGLPVVVTVGVGVSSLVEKYKAGIVVEKAAERISQALLKILQDVNLQKEMGENGKRLVLEEFLPKKVAMRMKSVYEETIK